MKKFISGIFAIALIALWTVPSFAADPQVWTGTNSGAWTDDANWGANDISNGENLTFTTNSNVASDNDNEVNAVGNILFDAAAGAFVLTGSGGGENIALNGSVTQADDSLQTININMSLAAARVFDVTGTGGLTIGGILSGAGGVTKTGAQLLTLAGVNTYSGVTTITAGTLSIAASSGLGDGSGTNDISLGGGTLITTAGLDLDSDRATTLTAGSAIQSNAGTLTISGTVDNGGNLLTLQGAGNITATGIISGAGGLTKGGAGNLTLSGVNTYQGVTTIGGTGTVLLGNAAGLGDVAAGTTIAANSALDLNGMAVGAENITSVQGTGVGGTGAITNSAVGAASLSGAITMAAATSIGSAGGAMTLSGNVDMGGFALTVLGAGNTTLSGIVSNGSIVKNAAGNLTLSGANTYAGATTINAGTVLLGNAAGLGTNVGATTVAATGAALDLNGVAVVSSEALTINGTGVGNAGALLNSNAAAASFNGNITLGSASEISSNGAGGLTLSGNIDNGGFALTIDGANATALSGIISNGSLIKQGAGTATLSGANTFTGTAAVNAGTLALAGTAAIEDTVEIQMADVAGAILQLNASETIGSINTGGTTGGNISLQGFTLTTGDAGNDAYGGIISGTGSIVKQGAGTWTLTGANTYSGSTTINAGIINMRNNTALGTGAGGIVVANTNSALQLDNTSGNLVIGAAALTINGDGPTGAGAVENLIGNNSFAGNITLGSASLIGSTAGTLTHSGNTANGGFLLTVGGAGDIADSGIISGTGGLTKIGAGTLTVSGVNTYSGTTTLTAGTLSFGAASGLGDASATNVISLGGGTLQSTATQTLVANRAITLTGNAIVESRDATETLTTAGTVTLGANQITLSGAGNHLVSGVVSGAGGTVVKTGAGTATITGANTYTGVTTITTGALNIQNNTALGTVAGGVTIANNAVLQLQGGITVGADNITDVNGSGAGGTGAILNVSGNNSYAGTIFTTTATTIGSTAGTLTLSGAIDNNGTLLTTLGAGNITLSGIISDTGGLTHTGAGTLSLGGVNTFTGVTTLNNATTGVLNIPNDAAVGGALTLTDGALTLTDNLLTIGGAFTSAAGTEINTTLSGTALADYGRVASTAGATAITAATVVNMTVNTFVPNGTTVTIVDGAAAGAVGNATLNIINSTPSVTWAQVASTSDLIFQATRVTTGVTTTSNNTSVAQALATITNPSADLTLALTQLDTLTTAAEVDAAYGTLDPDASAGNLACTFAGIMGGIGATEAHLGDINTGNNAAQTGVGSGDQWKDNAVWIKGFGTFADQDKRDNVNGYEATVWGGAGGIDWLQTDRMRIGFGGGYAASDVDTKIENNTTDIDSYQGMLYGTYNDGSPWYMNGIFNFAYHNYEGKRGIAFGTLSRTASSDYDGQQYTGSVSTGYKYEQANWADVTPMASLTYSHLNIESYTESGAGDLNLNVASQDYDFLQMGLGVKLSKNYEDKYGTYAPEVHAKWLYDFIGDEASTTSTFTGGGSAFTTRGFDPEQSSFNVGTGITWFSKGSVSLSLNYDFEIKEDYLSHNGMATLRWTY